MSKSRCTLALETLLTFCPPAALGANGIQLDLMVGRRTVLEDDQHGRTVTGTGCQHTPCRAERGRKKCAAAGFLHFG